MKALRAVVFGLPTLAVWLLFILLYWLAFGRQEVARLLKVLEGAI